MFADATCNPCCTAAWLAAVRSQSLTPFQSFLKEGIKEELINVLRKELPNRIPSHFPAFVLLTIQVANREGELKRRQSQAYCVGLNLCCLLKVDVNELCPCFGSNEAV